jgi:anti-sigma factor RsiW
MPERTEPGSIDEQLFAYATGELEPAARARVEALLKTEPALRARLAWYEAVCDGLVHTLPALDALPAADEIIKRIRGRTARRGFFAWLAGPALKPAAALAALLVIMQGAVIAMLALERADTTTVRSTASRAQTVFLVVAFDPQASEAAIRALLLQARATIVDGPKQLGEYRLAVSANRAQFARSLLEQSKIVEYVRPERP